MQNYLKIAWNRGFSHSLIKNASFVIVGTAINGLVNFVFLIIAARLYSPEAVGLSSAAISSVALISLISELGLGIGIIRFLKASGREGGQLLNFSLTMNFGASAITTVVFLVGLNLWTQSLLPIRQSPLLLVVFVIFSMTSAMQPLLTNVFLARLNTRYVASINITVGILKIIFLVVISYVLNSSFGILVAVGLAGIIGVMLSIFWYLPKVQPGYLPVPVFKIKKIRELLEYSIGNYVGRLLLQCPPIILPLIILNFLGAEKNAVYYVSYGIASILAVIPTSICNSLFAEVSNNAASLRQNTVMALKFMAVIVVPATLIIIFIAGYLLAIFGKLYSEEGSFLLRMIAVAIIPWGINYLYISIARFEKRTRDVIIIAGISTVLSLGLSFGLLLKMGMIGVGIGYLVGQFISMLAVVVPIRRIVSRKAAGP